MAPTRRLLPTILAVVAAALLAVGAVGALALCSVFGCTVFSEDFEPDGEEATRSRALAEGAATRTLDSVTAGRPVLAEAGVDGCRLGQNNWKIKDTYSHECVVVASRTVLVVADGGFDEVGEGLSATDAAVRAHGCTARSRGLAEVRAEYWSQGNPQVEREGAAGIPGAAYECADLAEVSPGTVRLEVDPTSARTVRSDASGVFGPTWVDLALRDEWYTEADAAAVVGSGAALAVVHTVRVGYYDTEF